MRGHPAWRRAQAAVCQVRLEGKHICGVGPVRACCGGAGRQLRRTGRRRRTRMRRRAALQGAFWKRGTSTALGRHGMTQPWRHARKKITAAPRWRLVRPRCACRFSGKRGAKPPHARLRGSRRVLPRRRGFTGGRAQRRLFYSPAGRRAARFAEPSCVFFGRERAENTLRGFCRMAFCKCRYSSFSFACLPPGCGPQAAKRPVRPLWASCPGLE